MRMKRVSVVICSLLSAGLLLIGCSRLPAITLDELLAEVNSTHQVIDNDGLRSKFILRQPVAENGEPISVFDRYSYYAGELEPYDPNLVLTQEQMIEDVTYLFDALYACYGNYDQMGGQAAFDAAEQAILEECRQVDSLRAEDFQQLLIPHFAFIQDGNFQIQNQLVCPSWYPFFFREVDFYKVDGQYITADHKTVASVDGCDDLTELFKRSISPKGEIVWYPVLLRDSTTCNETLTVHYTDGSTQVLQSTPCDYSDQMDQFLSMDQKAIPEVRYDGDIPVLQINGMQGGRSIPGWDEAFLEGAETLGNSKIGILDLRFNPGGKLELLADWINTYAKTPVPANSIFRDAFTGEQMVALCSLCQMS